MKKATSSFTRKKACEGCEWEFDEAIRAQDEMGLHFATTTKHEIDGRKHFFLLMVDDDGNLVMY